MSLSSSRSLFPGKYLAEAHVAALVAALTADFRPRAALLWYQPQPAFPSACTPIFQCMQTAHRQCSLAAQGGQVFHKKFPIPNFPHDACSPSKTHKLLSQVSVARTVQEARLDPESGNLVCF